jgi:hypothetical protein
VGPHQRVVYTQDRPFAGTTLYRPTRNPHFNDSNYRARVSTPDFRGVITGRISDAQGGRLPGASVSAINVATNVESTTTTDAAGDYAIPYLTSGTYRLTVELSGSRRWCAKESKSASGIG